MTLLKSALCTLPDLVPNKGLAAGDVGYIAASIKNIQDTRVGDTITTVKNAAAEPLPGYKKVNPWYTAESILLTVHSMKI